VEGTDWSQYKMCIFLNPFVVTADVSDAITRLLKNDNRTLVWTYAAGIFNSATVKTEAEKVGNSNHEPLSAPSVNVSTMSELVDVVVERGAAPQVRGRE
jgi:hypothetical protein